MARKPGHPPGAGNLGFTGATQMIVLLGSVVIQPGRLEEALALSQVHVRRGAATPYGEVWR